MNKIEIIKTLLKLDKMTEKVFTDKIVEPFRKGGFSDVYSTYMSGAYSIYPFAIEKDMISKSVIIEAKRRFEKVLLNEVDNIYSIQIEEIDENGFVYFDAVVTYNEYKEDTIKRIKRIVYKCRKQIKDFEKMPGFILHSDTVDSIIKFNI